MWSCSDHRHIEEKVKTTAPKIIASMKSIHFVKSSYADAVTPARTIT